MSKSPRPLSSEALEARLAEVAQSIERLQANLAELLAGPQRRGIKEDIEDVEELIADQRKIHANLSSHLEITRAGEAEQARKKYERQQAGNRLRAFAAAERRAQRAASIDHLTRTASRSMSQVRRQFELLTAEMRDMPDHSVAARHFATAFQEFKAHCDRLREARAAGVTDPG